MIDITKMTLEEVKSECLKTVQLTNRLNVKKLITSCEELCDIKCKEHNLGWFPGKFVLK